MLILIHTISMAGSVAAPPSSVMCVAADDSVTVTGTSTAPTPPHDTLLMLLHWISITLKAGLELSPVSSVGCSCTLLRRLLLTLTHFCDEALVGAVIMTDMVLAVAAPQLHHTAVDVHVQPHSMHPVLQHVQSAIMLRNRQILLCNALCNCDTSKKPA